MTRREHSAPSLVLSLLLSLFAVDATAAAADFLFTGLCDDCAFSGDPSDPGFDPLDDGLFQPVTAVLHLTDVSLNASGLIEVDSNNFGSFTYNGSTLINPFTFSDAFTIRGLLDPTGVVQPTEALRLESSDGPGGSFSFPDFCTELGEAVLESCGGVGLVSFELDAAGEWLIEGTEAFDVGGGGQLTLVPLPGALPLLILGIAGVGCATRRVG